MSDQNEIEKGDVSASPMQERVVMPWKPISEDVKDGSWVVVASIDKTGYIRAAAIASYGVRPSHKGGAFDVVGGDVAWRCFGHKHKAFPLEPTHYACFLEW